MVMDGTFEGKIPQDDYDLGEREEYGASITNGGYDRAELRKAFTAMDEKYKQESHMDSEKSLIHEIIQRQGYITLGDDALSALFVCVQKELAILERMSVTGVHEEVMRANAICDLSGVGLSIYRESKYTREEA